jgi:hypothetical protein
MCLSNVGLGWNGRQKVGGTLYLPILLGNVKLEYLKDFLILVDDYMEFDSFDRTGT